MSTREHSDVFITQLDINEVWELKDIQILLSETEMKHLILTGKNGSGKTTVLNAVAENLGNREFAFESQSQHVGIRFLHDNWVTNLISQGEFILAHFPAKRGSYLPEAKGIKSLDLKQVFEITESASQHFLQYIVNLKAQRSFAKDDGENDTASGIDNWFENFTGALQKIYDDPGLELVFDRLNFNFLIRLSNEVEFDFNQLSDGYSAIISIVSELILRMEKLSPIVYDLQGLVLIDEIETHLHVDLQKKILPFLTTFFPRIQFIVTTHSPFVISSVENAVVYDLERRIRIEDASGYSYDTIIESYFDSDKYSEALKRKVAEYEALLQLQERNSAQEVRLIELEKYFDNLPMQLSPELEVKVQQLRLARL